MTLVGATSFQAADASGTAHDITLNGTLSGVGNLVKTGGGMLTLNGTNTYVGTTTVNSGILAGTGIISGPVAINSGGALSPGNPLGTLIISNNLTLAADSATLMLVQHSPLTNSAVKVSSILTEGGTLTITNSNATTFAAGDSFKLFNAGAYSGAFANYVLPSLPAGLAWNPYMLNVSGTLSVVTLTSPAISSVKIYNGNLVISGTGGQVDWPYYVLVTTNLESSQWTPLATNQFDASGNFVFTNALNPTWPQSFFRLQLQ
jgi:autotransporter-associated beta strand protein